jgi:hypothetical protein
MRHGLQDISCRSSSSWPVRQGRMYRHNLSCNCGNCQLTHACECAALTMPAHSKRAIIHYLVKQIRKHPLTSVSIPSAALLRRILPYTTTGVPPPRSAPVATLLTTWSGWVIGSPEDGHPAVARSSSVWLQAMQRSSAALCCVPGKNSHRIRHL